MRAKIVIGDNEESIKNALKVLQVIFSMIDKVVRIKLSDSARAKCDKNRKKMPNTKAKEDNDQVEQEKEEKLRKEMMEEKERVRKMTPEQRKKWEAKKNKADI